MYFEQYWNMEDLERNYKRLMKNHDPEQPGMERIREELQEIQKEIRQDYETRKAQIEREGNKNMKKDNIIERAAEIIRNTKQRSAWGRGVSAYALELLEGLEIDAEDLEAPRILHRAFLNGADDWNMYSWGGCSLIYNADIAERLCNNTELKKTRNGERRPNSREEWLDTQARALFQAEQRAAEAIRQAVALERVTEEARAIYQEAQNAKAV